MEPAEALRRIAFLLESEGAETYKVRAFRNAAATVDSVDAATLAAGCTRRTGSRTSTGSGRAPPR